MFDSALEQFVPYLGVGIMTCAGGFGAIEQTGRNWICPSYWTEIRPFSGKDAPSRCGGSRGDAADQPIRRWPGRADAPPPLYLRRIAHNERPPSEDIMRPILTLLMGVLLFGVLKGRIGGAEAQVAANWNQPVFAIAQTW